MYVHIGKYSIEKNRFQGGLWDNAQKKVYRLFVIFLFILRKYTHIMIP